MNNSANNYASENAHLNMLAQEYLSGNEKAFDGIYEACFKIAKGWFYKNVASDKSGGYDLEDLFQNAITRMWMRFSMFDADKGNLSAWFCRIFKNEFLSECRRRANYCIESFESLENDAIISADSVENSSVESLSLDQILDTAKKVLSRNQEEAIRLFYVNDCSLEEISTKQHVSVNTVKSRLFQGREKLRDIYSDHDLAA